jgi:hypothetical protein
MEDQPHYGKSKRLKKKIEFENGKAIYFEYDCSEMEEEAFAEALEKANQTNPRTMKDFLNALHNIFQEGV